MGKEIKIKITVQTTVSAPVEKVWEKWTNPDDIIKWNTASEDWHTTKAENDLRAGGKFSSRMEAKDGSFGFDFEAIYSELVAGEKFTYVMTDGRKASVNFNANAGKTEVVVTFDAETENSIEMQKAGWQAILNNFKNYTENN